MELKYKAFYFDCDGVILNSNNIKTEAFYEIALPYGKKYAKKFVDYHKSYGGISRFEKFEFFFKNILQKDYSNYELEKVLEEFGELSRNKMLNCSICEGFIDFISKIDNKIPKFVVSGGLESDLIYVLKKRKLDLYFTGIFGSPQNKFEIMANINKDYLPSSLGLFLGDSKYDHQIAQKYNLDFIFLSKYTEFNNWKNYFKNYKKVKVFNSFKDLI